MVAIVTINGIWENKLCFALPFSRIVVILQARNKIPMNNIKRIVLTGGPCAGKTTAQVRIVEHFSNLGFKVFTVPEVPTMYSQGGWSYLTPNPKLYYEGELTSRPISLRRCGRTSPPSAARAATSFASAMMPCSIWCLLPMVPSSIIRWLTMRIPLRIAVAAGRSVSFHDSQDAPFVHLERPVFRDRLLPCARQQPHHP